MPFGYGCYAWRWDRRGWRVGLEAFALAFPAAAAAGCLVALRGGPSLRRLAPPLAALLVGLLGLAAMLDWLSRIDRL